MSGLRSHNVRPFALPVVMCGCGLTNEAPIDGAPRADAGREKLYVDWTST